MLIEHLIPWACNGLDELKKVCYSAAPNSPPHILPPEFIMLLLVRTATRVVTLLVSIACIPTYAVDEIREESEFLVLAAAEGFDSPQAPEELLIPSIEITSDGFVSHLSTTHWRFATDILVFHTDYGSVDFRNDDGEDKVASGVRFTLGWESDAGYGVRTRLSGVGIEGSADMIVFSGSNQADPVIEGFDYHGVSPTDASSSPTELAAGVWDIDLYKRATRGPSEILLGVGLRSAALRTEVPSFIENSIATGGVSLFSELRHVVYESEKSELALIGSGRLSFLTGEWESKISSGMIEVDTDMTINEGALGIEWARRLGTRVLTLRAQYEAQRWDSDVTSDVSFSGGSIRAGIHW